MRRTERTAAEVPMMTRRMPSRSTRATMASLVACPHRKREREESVCARTASREREDGDGDGESVCPHREERTRERTRSREGLVDE